MGSNIDCYWIWETKNDKDLAERLEGRIKRNNYQEFIDDLNSLKGQVMSLKDNRKDLKGVIVRRIEGFILKTSQKIPITK